MPDFLLELRSEEIPARMQAKARNDLARLFAECTAEAGLETGAIDVHSTPRRLVLIARDVADATQASREELKGPRANAPPQALEGFLRKTGLTRDQLEERDGLLFAVVERPGRAAADVLADAVRRIVADFAWPKSMRWGAGSARWVRPLQGIVALLGEDIVEVEIAGIAAGAATVGHRFHHPGPITIGGAHDYAEKLRACHVIVDQDERERLIRDGAEAAAAAAGLTLLADEGLVVENAGLTEWPVPLFGRFDPEFLDVPREVIVLTMRTNQKYFACTGANGALASAFVCVANIDASDGGEAIVEGNRRVLAARLADARFFWEQDLKVPLEEQAKKLDGIVFHEKLGTVADKVERVAKLARWLVEEGVVKGADADEVERAARLAKTDLVTGMVGEFPELQGVIGGYLAEAQGEPKVVAEAIRGHYKPVGQGDEIPTAPVTVAVSLADKLDTLVIFFAVGEAPSGSRDPFALRRSALAALSIIVTHHLRFSIRQAVSHSYAFLQQMVTQRIKEATEGTLEAAVFLEQYTKLFKFAERSGLDQMVEFLKKFSFDRTQQDEFTALQQRFNTDLHGEGLQTVLLGFFADRLKVQQREAGVRHDLIDAVFALGGEDDLVRLLARVKALQVFIETEDGRNLLSAYRRAASILKIEQGRGVEIRPTTLLYHAKTTADEQLVEVLNVAGLRADRDVENEAFESAMSQLATLRRPIDDFFDQVLVNDHDENVRGERLGMLMRFRDAVHRVADFSKIEG